MPRVSVVFSSHNAGKLRELRGLLAHLPVDLLSLSDAGHGGLVVVEDGDTFEANAEKKAREAARRTTMVALADDSGLEVDALGGRPGVKSARFAHEHATDAENNAALLAALDEFRDEERSARFRCTLCLVDPWSTRPATFVRGVCEGRIARAPSGTGGFGYDPLFLVDDAAGRAMAELSDDEKGSLSHRGRAFRGLESAFRALFA